MTKRLIELDDDLLDAAQRELNTTGVALHRDGWACAAAVFGALLTRHQDQLRN